MKKVETKVCGYSKCKKPFKVSANKRKKYCDAKCNDGARRERDRIRFAKTQVERTCVTCKETFKTNSRTKEYCSSECVGIGREKRRTETRTNKIEDTGINPYFLIRGNVLNRGSTGLTISGGQA